MEFWSILGIIVGIWGIIELTLYFLTSFVRRHFQWLILGQDEKPELSNDGLNKFIPHGYDTELGWIRKPHTSNKETSTFSKSNWSINDKGARTNPKFDDLSSVISCYGDSFTFCRQVNDNETWEHFLSQTTNTNVKNFGVGNYGIDQSLLRLKREFPTNNTKLVIMGVVPDTISRIMSYWKHYYEYGNTFAFKPKFKLENNNLKLLPNIIDEESKFQNFKNYLKEIQEEDYFYKKKFLKEIIRFPFVFTVFRNFRRNFTIIYWVTLLQIKKMQGKSTNSIEWNPMKPIMKINLEWRISLYNNKTSTSLLFAILQEYAKFSKEQNFVPIFAFIPQKDDLIFIKKNHNFLKEFLDDLHQISNLYVIDIISELLKEPNIDELYSDDNEYGGHPNKIGNQKISNIIQKFLIEKKILN